MKAHTISDAFRRCIGEREVSFAFFSTYSFEPDFFELEVIPLLLGDQALSSQDDIRYVQLQALMQDKARRFAVAHDMDVFNPAAGSRLEVDYLPVRIGGACQHAKLAILVVKGEQGEAAIVLAAGSFNLTKAGWWDNIEVGHFVELSATHAPGNILGPLRRALRFFQASTPTPALDGIVAVQAGWSPSADDPDCSFYFSGAARGRLAFLDFLHQDLQRPETAKGTGTLEIISPFFAEAPTSGSTQELMSEFGTVRLLLPQDEDRRALVDPAVYSAFEVEQWCDWAEQWQDSHKVHDKPLRRLHAKVFQGLGKRPWQFVGSVNFSHKAFNENVEAGFLLQGRALAPLLSPSTTSITGFAEVPGTQSAETQDGLAMPVLCLAYDWESGVLEVTAQAPISGELTLLDSSDGSVATLHFERATQLVQPLPALREHLQRSSLLNVCWQAGGECVARWLMVTQHNIYCRPSHLPAMDLQSLLRLFIEMRMSRKISQFGELAQRLLSRRHANEADEHLPQLPDEGEDRSFFSEFSQVNGAFWQLERTLERAEAEGNHAKLAYYLAGCQPDSLRAMLDSVQAAAGDEETLVVRYLTLVSMQGLLNRYPQHRCADLEAGVGAAIRGLERQELLGQLDEGEGRRFLQWFRAQFQRRLSTSKSPNKEVAHAADQ
ncbi:hypothetical protein PMI38_02073 [Pseudomonas sp. GM84]|uniref:hypothetical protein n=1 Tax=Pseudomonas sp. GM84 TaxID=1144340 RepID=UPI00026F5EDE|nr:hypothetical protein [Pseudomonas sp. GM84]EJN38449.1 hypothetical protein PMI38_02073 [Pseudomonas sp. GM84]